MVTLSGRPSIGAVSDSDPLRRYVDAGIALTQLTRAKAEAIVKELVKAGEVQREQTHDRVEELLDRSRKTTEGVMGVVRKEMAEQLAAMGFATTKALEELEARIEGLERRLDAMAATPAPPGPGPAKAAKASKASKAKPAAKPAAKAGKGPAKAAGGAKQAAPPPGTAARTTGPQKAPRRRSGPGADTAPDQA